MQYYEASCSAIMINDIYMMIKVCRMFRFRCLNKLLEYGTHKLNKVNNCP